MNQPGPVVQCTCQQGYTGACNQKQIHQNESIDVPVANYGNDITKIIELCEVIDWQSGFL